ncbi:MAG TPA: glycerophosphodiester phosphodiesterase [Cryomorphaceae bacterium]|nr:glycerophosphodiester phosphodiesterase [Cryomorphaceae bacterium]|tara:strand:- start:155 stop:1039 length:885 start_codon:yes stop_codon:yes gene_type:complete
MKHSILVLCSAVLLINCTRPKRTLDLQGHRGARGLYPENSIVGFTAALEFPEVRTLELDLCVTKDDQLIISHEPWFNEIICEVADSTHEGFEYCLYKMTYDSIAQFDFGAKGHPDFPNQQPTSAHKPLLNELFTTIKREGLRWPHFNIEIKSHLKGDNIYHPRPNKFAALVVSELSAANVQYPEADLLNHITVQSFDPRVLREMRKTTLPVKLALLSEEEISPAEQMDELGFPVDTYSPNYEQVTPELIAWCHFRRISVIPWTVNNLEQMQALVDMGVDGIISDYPNLFAELIY